MDLSWAFSEIKSKYGPIMGFLRDQKQIWTYHGLSHRPRASIALSWAFSEIKSKYDPIIDFLRNQEQV